MASQEIGNPSRKGKRQPAPLSDTQVNSIAGEIVALIHDRKTASGVRMNELKQVLAVEFGRRHGWKWCPDSYGAQHLFGKRPQYHRRIRPPHNDHASGYRISRLPVAIVSQPYPAGKPGDNAWIDTMRLWAAQHGLVLSFPNFPSWWYPGWTRLCVFTLPENAVR